MSHCIDATYTHTHNKETFNIQFNHFDYNTMSETTGEKATTQNVQPAASESETVSPKCTRPEASNKNISDKKRSMSGETEELTTVEDTIAAPKSSKKPKKSKIQDIVDSTDPLEFQAEHLLIQFGNKVISKLLQNGYLQTPLFKEIARLAKAKGYDINLRKVANDYIFFIPTLRALRDIGLDLSYEDDFLLRLAIKWRLATSVQFLLKNGANPMALNGQPLLDAYMPSSHSRGSDLFILNILLGAITDMQDVPKRLLNEVIKDKDHPLFDAILARTKGEVSPCLSACFKKIADAPEPDWKLVSSFIMHQPRLVASFTELLSGKPSFYKHSDIFALLLEHEIKLTPTDAMKEHVDAYCQRMLDESNMVDVTE